MVCGEFVILRSSTCFFFAKITKESPTTAAINTTTPTAKPITLPMCEKKPPSADDGTGVTVGDGIGVTTGYRGGTLVQVNFTFAHPGGGVFGHKLLSNG